MTSGRTALLVVAAETERAGLHLRLQLDPVARLGVRLCVTVPFPFMPASQISSKMSRRT
jgi:hypothetical protein